MTKHIGYIASVTEYESGWGHVQMVILFALTRSKVLSLQQEKMGKFGQWMMVLSLVLLVILSFVF
jgi:hypothetical protein